MSDVETPSKKDKDSKSYEEKVKYVSAISQPLASKKLTKKVYKVVKKASKAKVVKRGVKEVVKALKKGNKGLCIVAGDISPIDVISHLPILCEEAGVPYVYVPSKSDLGTASSTKRPTSCILVVPSKEFDSKDLLDEVKAEVQAITPAY